MDAFGVQGICQHPPQGGFLPRYSPAAPRQPTQCVIVADSNLLRVNNPEAQLWLHGLFVRVARQAPNATHPRLVTLQSGSLWATQVTLDGFRQPALAALVDTGARAHFESAPLPRSCVHSLRARARLLFSRRGLAGESESAHRGLRSAVCRRAARGAPPRAPHGVDTLCM